MNAGFSNLATLKGKLLANTLKNSVQFDDLILTIGTLVAGQFEKHCNRKFAYQVGEVEVFGADRVQFLLSRYPVVAPITLVEYKQDEQTGWVTQIQGQDNMLTIRSLNTKSGIINFPENEDCGPWYAEMRFTYTGGFWWQQLDKDDPAFNPNPPAGVPLLPPDLYGAWILQCKHLWAFLDKIGLDTLKDGSSKSIRFPEDWAIGVEQILGLHVRYQLT